MIELVIEQRRRNLGGGFEVGRVLPFHKRRMIGPFVFFDHMGPLDLAPGIDRNVDVRPHPHIGLSTVSYLFSGEIMHRDSLGYEQAIRPQEVNWMTAGSGITHSERFERARAQGDHLHGIQAWVALPDGQEEIDPAFSHHAGSDLPQWSEAGVVGQLIAGSAYGLTAGTRTHSPLFYAHLDMAPGATAEAPGGHSERALYIALGAVEMDGRRYEAGRMLVLGAAASPVRALERSSVMVLGGEPVGERFIHWNFVSSSKDRLAQAALDWKAGRMKLPDADNAEFIPCPKSPAALRRPCREHRRDQHPAPAPGRALASPAVAASGGGAPPSSAEETHDMALRTHVVASETGAGTFAVRIAMEGHSMIGDEPIAAGGHGLGPSPFQLLSASLAECTAMTVRWFARQNGWRLEHVEVSVDHTRRSVAGAPARDVFDKTVSIRGSLLTDEQRIRLLEVAAKCPVQRVLEGGSVFAAAVSLETARAGRSAA